MKNKFLIISFLSLTILGLAGCDNKIISSSSSSTTSSSSSSSTSSYNSDQVKKNTINYFGKEVSLDEHHIYVNMNLKDEDKSEFAYNDLLAANEYITNSNIEASSTNPIIIYLDKGVYWVDDRNAIEDTTGDNMIGLEIKKDYVHIYGMDKDASLTVIAGNRGNREGSLGNWNVMCAGNDFVSKDLTIGNYVSIDLDYSSNPSLSVKARNGSSITQGQTIVARNYGENDKWQFENVRFMTRLNAIPGGVKRAYFKNCHIECTDDAIEPGVSTVYENCDFDFYGKHPLWGSLDKQITFFNCTFKNKAEKGTFYFGKAPSHQVVIDCIYEDSGNGFDSGFEWCNDIASYSYIKNYVYNSTYKGKSIEVSPSTDTTIYLNEDSKLLKAFKVNDVYNSYNLLKGNDDWDPNNVKEKVGNNFDLPYYLNLDIEKDAIGYNGKLNHGEIATINASFVSTSGNKDVDYTVSVSDPNYLIVSKNGNQISLQAKNQGATIINETVTVTSNSGLKRDLYLSIYPEIRKAPTYKVEPSISLKEGYAKVEYALNETTNEILDKSIVKYYRSSDNKFDDNDIEIAISRFNLDEDVPFTNYTLTHGDVNSYIIATIAPKTNISKQGDIKTIISNKVSENDVTLVTENEVKPDLKHLSNSNKKIEKGTFSFDNHIPNDIKEKYYPDSVTGEVNAKYKEFEEQTNSANVGFDYTRGIDGALNVYGFSNAGRGARMLYTPLDKQNKNMSMDLVLNPAKKAGQGFGSAHGQYLDIYIGYDTTSLTGYGLRIERETPYSNSCLFGLYRFENDVATYISTVKTNTEKGEFNGLFAQAFRGNVNVKITLTDNKLTASIVSDVQSDLIDDDHKNSVSLQADITNTVKKGGFGFMHTGTTSEGNRTTISSIDVKYTD